MRLWVNPTTTAQLLPDDARRREQIYDDIDGRGFGWQVWWVASSGFFTESYNLFATNVILPSLAYIYWPTDNSSSHETKINLVTLAGSVIGQLVFGFLADIFGRRKLYGTELFIMIFGIIGLAGSATGYNSMDMMGWLIFYRFVIGVAIGAEYPLSAVITAEFAPAQSRARMLVALVLMQPLGQMAAAAVGLIVLVTLGKQRGLDKLTESEEDHDVAAAINDQIWRIVVGVGAFPALIAIAFRLAIPESPRFTLDVGQNAKEALKNNQEYLGKPVEDNYEDIFLDRGESDIDDDNRISRKDVRGAADSAIVTASHNSPSGEDEITFQKEGHQTQRLREHEIQQVPQDHESNAAQVNGVPPAQANPSPSKVEGLEQFSWADIRQYFWVEGNWRYLAGCSACWFTLDVVFYGLGVGSPRVIAQLWASARVTNATPSLPEWGNPPTPSLSIYDTLYQDYIHYIITVTIGSLLGSLIIIKIIDYVPRKSWLAWSYLALSALLAIVGGSYFAVAYTDLHALTITLYALLQVIFNLGPNTLVFAIAAEIFPTRYRATCHGIAAASGKFGGVFMQSILIRVKVSGANSTSLGWLLISFAFVLASGAFFTWAWIPDLQYQKCVTLGEIEEGVSRAEKMSADEEKQRKRCKGNKIPSKALETLAKGRLGDNSISEAYQNRLNGGLLT